MDYVTRYSRIPGYDFEEMQLWKTGTIFLSSLLLRLWLAPRLDFGVDQRAIFEIGRKFYETGIIPAEGPRLVYTGESIPGGFQAVMAGLPLFFSSGAPIGLQIWVAVLNCAAMLLLFLWLRAKVKPEQRDLLACFLAFSPWSLLFSPAWNPSFLPIFAVPFFWMLERSLIFARKNWEAFGLGLIFILCLQLHLSAVLLLIALAVAWPSIHHRGKFALSFLWGIFIGGLFLIPWLMQKLRGTASAPTGVVGLHFENLADIPKAFFRYISFPTAEISRFITPQGHGFRGMLDVLAGAPWLWVPAVISFAGSIVMMGWFLRSWWNLRRGLAQGFSRLEFLMPLLMTATFLFSIKGASAHTFWILMPLAFYSMAGALADEVWTMRRTCFAWVYIAGSLVFTVGGFARVAGLIN